MRDRVVAQRLARRCATMRSNMRFAASTRQNAPRTHAPNAHHNGARVMRTRATHFAARAETTAR
eukprot:5903841-Lingulodinium_polyedra.AAC.1